MWKVIQQTGKRVILVRDGEQKDIRRPANMTLKDFVIQLPLHSTISDDDLISKFPDLRLLSDTTEKAA